MPLALIVDDSRAMRLILAEQLTGLGLFVSEASDGEAALRSLDTLPSPPDVALIDWNMPVMNGLQLITRLRAEPRYRAMRILVVTSESEAGRMVDALAAGADEYLMKPFTPEALASKLGMIGVVTPT